MTSASTLFGVTAFLLVCAGMLLVIGAFVVRGLWRSGRARGQARRLADAEGWRYGGMDRFSGHVGGHDWCGGAFEDTDDQARWTEFDGGVPGVSPGGFVVLSRAAWQQSLAGQRPAPSAVARVVGQLVGRAEAAIDETLHRATGGLFRGGPDHPDDDRVAWQPQPVGSTAFGERWVMLASHPRWTAVWTPTVDALWRRAHADGPDEVLAQAQHHRLRLKRDDDSAAPTLAQVAALLRLGQALMRATQDVAAGRAPAGPARVEPALAEGHAAGGSGARAA